MSPLLSDLFIQKVAHLLVLLPGLQFPVLVLSVSSLILLNASGDVVPLLLLHQLLVAIIDLVTHLIHDFLHAGVTSSDLLQALLLFPLSSSHLFLNSFRLLLLELLLSNGSLLTVLFIISNHFESCCLIFLLLLRQALLINLVVLL